MKADLADITVVLDRSGSMLSVQADTIGGFNAFIEAQRKVPGECNASLVQFDDQYEVVYTSKPVKDAPAGEKRGETCSSSKNSPR